MRNVSGAAISSATCSAHVSKWISSHPGSSTTSSSTEACSPELAAE
ncbi:hypothetical protein AB0882_25445 [Streptomyces sp. NPDC012485]